MVFPACGRFVCAGNKKGTTRDRRAFLAMQLRVEFVLVGAAIFAALPE
jgi:hypothetical protein